MRQMEAPQDEGDTELSPPDGLSESERLTRSRFCPVENDDSGSLSTRRQFSLAAMMTVLFFICIGLSGAQWPAALASLFAGALGLFLLAVFIWTKTTLPAGPVSPVIWGGVVIAYVVACAVAVMRLTL